MKPNIFITRTQGFEHAGFVIEASKRMGRKLTTIEASDYWYGQSFNFIKNNPLQWVGLLAKKFFIFWNAYELPINGLEYNICKNYFPLLKAPLINFGIIAPLALLGMILLFNKNEKLNLLLLYTFMYLLGAIIYYNSSEYRFPVVISLFIFAAFTIWWIVNKLIKQEILPVVYATIGLFPLVLLVNNNLFKVDDQSNNGTIYNNIGTLFVCAGDYNNAIRHYKQAVIAYPEGLEFRDNLAHALYNSGMKYMAIDEYNKTIALIRTHISDDEINITTTSESKQSYSYYSSKIRFKLGEIYMQTNQFEKARDQFIAFLKHDSISIYAMNNLGIIYANLHDYQIAASWFERALKIKPDFSPALQNFEQIKQQMKLK